jgi:hypothetical protein
VAGLMSLFPNKANLSLPAATCARNTATTRSLVAAMVCMLFASNAQALPFGFACLFEKSQASSFDCRLTPNAALAGPVDVRPATGTISPLFGAIAKLPPAFEINGEPGQILFSLTTYPSKLEVVASMPNETLRAGVREGIRATVLDSGAGPGLAEHHSVPRSVALLLISSGIAGAGATSRRRRGLRRLSHIQVPWTSRKEMPTSTLVAAALFAQGSSHSTPLRI